MPNLSNCAFLRKPLSDCASGPFSPERHPNQSVVVVWLRTSGSTTVPELNNKYLSSNGTHVGLFTDGSQSSATVFNAATAPGDRHWTLQNTGNDHFGAVVGPSDRSLLIFRDLANPQITPPDGTLIEWNLWRLMPAPDFRLRVADMSGNQWIAISGSIIGWASSKCFISERRTLESNADPGSKHGSPE